MCAMTAATHVRHDRCTMCALVAGALRPDDVGAPCMFTK